MGSDRGKVDADSMLSPQVPLEMRDGKGEYYIRCYSFLEEEAACNILTIFSSLVD